MALATFKCDKCKKEYFVSIKKNNMCPKCGKPLNRTFKNTINIIDEDIYRDFALNTHDMFNFSDGK